MPGIKSFFAWRHSRYPRIVICILFATFFGDGFTSTSEQDQVLSTLLGANLPAISDYSRTPVYVDLFHQARRFGSPSAPWDEKAMLNDDGWPSGDFGVFLMTGQAEVSGIEGSYHLSFNGQAKVGVVASMARLRNQRYDPDKDLTTLEVDIPAHGDQLALSFTQTGVGIRNLKVIRPGYDPMNPPLFTTPFLEHIARFKTLRFMDWLRTNNNDRVTSWATRVSPIRTHYASAAGVPWEHIVALANQTGKDIWINIPVKADDDYVVQLARLLRSSLNPDTRIFIEYSNELWNAQFWQFNTNIELATAEVLSNPNSPLAYDGSNAVKGLANDGAIALTLNAAADDAADDTADGPEQPGCLYGGTQVVDGVGLPGFQFIQDAVEYDTRTHHSNQDVYDRIQPDDMKQMAIILATFVYQAAMMDDKMPRKR